MNKDRKFSPPAVGGISLLVVFAVLCLTVFALLSLTTVRADQRLADAAVQNVAEYYAADYEAQAVLAQLRAGEMPEGVSRTGDIYRYTCPVSSTQALEVEVQIQGKEYTVLRWQMTFTGEWAPDDSLDLWDGETF